MNMRMPNTGWDNANVFNSVSGPDSIGSVDPIQANKNINRQKGRKFYLNSQRERISLHLIGAET
jgi:hypothetical protein